MARSPHHMYCGLAAAAALLAVAYAFQDKYDTRNLPYDLQHTKDFVGVWRLRRVTGDPPTVWPPPTFIDFGINPIPLFGARTLNMTMTYYDGPDQYRSDWGYLLVRNATRRDPRWLCGFLTSSSAGWSMIEDCVVTPSTNTISTTLDKFLARSFDLDTPSKEINRNLGWYEVTGMTRHLTYKGLRLMDMRMNVRTSIGSDQYVAEYVKRT